MRTALFFCVATTLVFGACSRDKHRDLVAGQPIEPSAQGTWVGTLTIEGIDSQVKVVINQNDITLKGTYDSASNQTLLGANGIIQGTTTGPTLSFNLIPTGTGCAPTVTAGGQNNGSALSLTVNGTNCNGAALHGGTTLTKS